MSAVGQQRRVDSRCEYLSAGGSSAPRNCRPASRPGRKLVVLQRQKGDGVRVLGFGTYDLARHPRIGVIFEGLRAVGDDVSEINEPLEIDTDQRVAMLGRPWLVHRLVRRILTCWVALTRRRIRLPMSARYDAILVGYLGHFDVILSRLLFRRQTIVLDLLIFAVDTARDRGASGRLKLGLLGLIDRVAVRAADVVVVDTRESLALVPARQRAKAVVTPVGASASWFQAGAKRPQPNPTARLRVLFFGLFTPLHGTQVIGDALALLEDRADVEVTMVGHGQDLDATRARAGSSSRIQWLDWVSDEKLPALAAEHDVCLGIFGTTPKALRVVPNKVFQGAAAGCAILTSDTEPQRRALGDAAAVVKPGDSAALAAMLVQLADDRAMVIDLGERARARATSNFTSEAIVTELRARLLALAADRAGN
jgi:glycosyltransferase involved in cell wall biosynthesis